MKRAGYRSLYQLSETVSDGGTGLEPSEELLSLSSVSFALKDRFSQWLKQAEVPPPLHHRSNS